MYAAARGRGGAGMRAVVVCVVVTVVDVPNSVFMLVVVAMPCQMPMNWAASRMVWPR